MSDASSAKQTAIITIIASSLSGLIVGGLTGWFTLQSMEKQSEIARVAACYSFQAERARLALQKADSLVETSKHMEIFTYKVMALSKKDSEFPADVKDDYFKIGS